MCWGLSDSQVSLCVGVCPTSMCWGMSDSQVSLCVGVCPTSTCSCWGLSDSQVSLCVGVCPTSMCWGMSDSQVSLCVGAPRCSDNLKDRFPCVWGLPESQVFLCIGRLECSSLSGLTMETSTSQVSLFGGWGLMTGRTSHQSPIPTRNSNMFMVGSPPRPASSCLSLLPLIPT